MDRIALCVHDAPVQIDLFDLHDISTFFRGGHDRDGAQIAKAGREWTKKL
jgi:hypothetical protein